MPDAQPARQALAAASANPTPMEGVQKAPKHAPKVWQPEPSRWATGVYVAAVASAPSRHDGPGDLSAPAGPSADPSASLLAQPVLPTAGVADSSALPPAPAALGEGLLSHDEAAHLLGSDLAALGCDLPAGPLAKHMADVHPTLWRQVCSQPRGVSLLPTALSLAVGGALHISYPAVPAASDPMRLPLVQRFIAAAMARYPYLNDAPPAGRRAAVTKFVARPEWRAAASADPLAELPEGPLHAFVASLHAAVGQPPPDADVYAAAALSDGAPWQTQPAPKRRRASLRRSARSLPGSAPLTGPAGTAISRRRRRQPDSQPGTACPSDSELDLPRPAGSDSRLLTQ